jgi:hypothetical protein
MTFDGKAFILVISLQRNELTMTASATLRTDVFAAVKGNLRGRMRFLKNFKLSFDTADTSTVGSVSTKMFFDTRTLAASANETLDLAGVLVDASGAVLTFAKIHGIYVKADPANTNQVIVGAAASNGFSGPFNDITDAVKVDAGTEFAATSLVGWTVVATTGDLLKVANGGAGTPVSYDVVIIGE